PPRRTLLARFGHLCKSDFKFVQRIVARLIYTWRLGRRADEQSGEQVGQGRMVMPVTDQAAQQIGAAQKRRVSRCRATQDKMVTATGTGVPAVDHELLGGQSRLARLFVKKLSAFDQLIPGGGRLHVDLDHAW